MALDAITRGQATFTKRDLAMFVHRHSDGADQFNAVTTAVPQSPDLIELGKDVALSRHRDSADLHYGRDDFADLNRLSRSLSRERSKDTAQDHDGAKGFVERRGITFRERVIEIVRKLPGQVSSVFDSLDLSQRTPASQAKPVDYRASARFFAIRLFGVTLVRPSMSSA